jgi:plastocyanin
MRLPRLVATLLVLTLGAGGALGVAATSGAVAASPGAGKQRAAPKQRAAAKRAKATTCTKRQRVRLRRCRPSYRMSAKRLSPLAGRATVPALSPGTPSGSAPAPTTTTPAAPVPPPPPPPPPPVLSTLGANAYDMSGFVLRLTKTTVPAGDLTVFFTNHDVSDHNLWIESPAGGLERISDAIGLNASANKTVTVTAGTWRLFCSLPEHEAMTRDLTVTP